MARWRQEFNKKTGKSKFIPIDSAAKKRDGIIVVKGNFDPFISPVDGSLIVGQRSLENHNKRNNVVSADEFTPEFYAAKAKERADFYQGRKSREESLKCKREIYETWTQAERANGW